MFNLNFTKMKKLIYLFSLVVLLGISSSVMGQGTGTAPALGSTHTYKINGGNAVSGNTYTWTLEKGLGTPAPDADYDFGTVTNTASISVTWLSDATPGTDYYLRVVEAKGTCKNEKVLKIKPTNPFFLTITTTQTSPVCYNSDVVVNLDVNGEPEYDHGTITFVYTVSPNNIGSGSTYSFDLASVLSDDANFSTAAPTVTGGNLALGKITSTGTGSVTITYTVTNDVNFTNTSDANGTATDINLKVDISNGKTNQNVLDNNSGDYTETISAARPNTSAITTP